MSFSIMLKDSSRLSVKDDAHLFSEILDLNDYDARAYVSKNQMGIIISGIDKGTATSINGALSNKGYSSLIIPDEKINTLNVKPVKIATIAETVFLEDIFGNGTHYDYNDISAVAVTMNKTTEKMVAFEREYLLDLIFKDGTVLRFNSKKFNYAYLRDRKSHSVIQNFIELLNDIDSKTQNILSKDTGYALALSQQFEEISAAENNRYWDQYILWLSHFHLLDKEDLLSIKSVEVQSVSVPIIDNVSETETIEVTEEEQEFAEYIQENSSGENGQIEDCEAIPQE
ncbi:MAG: hypothetical protein NE327_15795, partial [Lentisphaeraceae bacterium]|nr:hypothetical protein [Lentisphaeraceae bacterium]